MCEEKKGPRAAAAAAGAAAPPRPPPPPSAATVARFCTPHALEECGRRCSVCKGSASVAAKGEFLDSECFQLEFQTSVISRVPRGRRLHLAGGWVHPSHQMMYHSNLSLWYCAACGCYHQQQIVNLAAACQAPPDAPMSKSRRGYLDRIARGLMPKVLSKAEKAARGHI